jgi:UrcA family protein
MNNLTKLLAAATLATTLFATAHAGQPLQARTQKVQLADLDTTTTQGAAVLYSRMNAAAGVVCGQRERIGTLFVSKAWEACVKNAMQGALAQINRPAVTAYAAARGVYEGDRAIKVASAR